MLEDMQEPPTLVSGYGVLTKDDLGKPPPVILESHEKKVKAWLEQANPYALKALVESCVNNSHFKIFKQNLWDTVEDRKFGDKPCEDILRFDVWLKKMEISESKPSPVLIRGSKTTSPSTESELVPPANPEAYKAYWDQYKRKGAGDLKTPSRESLSSTTVPSPALPSPPLASSSPSTSGCETGITPECKRKLSLEGRLVILRLLFLLKVSF